VTKRHFHPAHFTLLLTSDAERPIDLDESRPISSIAGRYSRKGAEGPHSWFVRRRSAITACPCTLAAQRPVETNRSVAPRVWRSLPKTREP
jgi:hypothetical protein